MNTTEEIIAKIRQRPDMLQIIEQLEKEMQEEERKREEFYELIHENCKAEFINGQILMHSPVKNKHWMACTNLSADLTLYVKQNKLGVVGTEKVLIRCTRNDYEPDIVFFGHEKAKNFTPNQMIFPPPDLAVEVLSESTKNNDYGIKFEDYATHQVAEYWIIDPDNQSIEQFTLSEGKYVLHQKLAKEGNLKSLVVQNFVVKMEDIFS
jgi:Uma2 family endonuclease